MKAKFCYSVSHISILFILVLKEQAVATFGKYFQKYCKNIFLLGEIKDKIERMRVHVN